MKFEFIKTLLSKAGTFFVTKPLVAATISIATLGGVVGTGVVIHNSMEQTQIEQQASAEKDKTNNKNKTENKTENKSENKNDKKDEISDEEVDKLLEEEKETEETTPVEETPVVEEVETPTESIVEETPSVPTQDTNSNTGVSGNSNVESTPTPEPTPQPTPEPTPQPEPTPEPTPSKPSGVDWGLSSEYFDKIARGNTNDPIMPVDEWNSVVDNVFFTEGGGPSTVKQRLNAYEKNGEKIFSAISSNIIDLGENPSFDTFLSAYVLESASGHYIYLRVYYNADTNSYSAYYVSAAVNIHLLL